MNVSILDLNISNFKIILKNLINKLILIQSRKGRNIQKTLLSYNIGCFNKNKNKKTSNTKNLNGNIKIVEEI